MTCTYDSAALLVQSAVTQQRDGSHLSTCREQYNKGDVLSAFRGIFSSTETDPSL